MFEIQHFIFLEKNESILNKETEKGVSAISRHSSFNKAPVSRMIRVEGGEAKKSLSSAVHQSNA